METVIKAKGGHVESSRCCLYVHMFGNICAKKISDLLVVVLNIQKKGQIYHSALRYKQKEFKMLKRKNRKLVHDGRFVIKQFIENEAVKNQNIYSRPKMN